MARKHPEEPAADAPVVGYVAPRADSGRLDRGQHRDNMADLKELTEHLSTLPQKVRRALPLDEETQDHLELLSNAERGDRRRLLLRTRQLVGAADLVALNAALAGNSPADQRDQATRHWRARILAEGDAAINGFVEVFPRAERQSLRANAREARGTSPGAVRAQGRLLQLLRIAAAPPPIDREDLDDDGPI
jgi:ribosome-associated protein